MKNPYAQVVFPVALDRAFTYRIPERFRDDVVPGVRVLCPFGRRRLTGFVVERNAEAAVSDLKEIEEVLDPTPLFTPQVLQLARWIADYYLCGWGEVLKAALPSGIHLDSQRVVRLMHSKPEELADSLQERAPRQAEIIRRLALQNPMRISRLAANLGKNVYAALQPLREKGLVRIELELPEPRVKAKYEVVARLAPHLTLDQIGSIISELQSKAPKQAAVLAALLDVVGGELSRADLRRLTGADHAVFTVLAERGFIVLDKREVVREYYQELEVEEPPKLTLNPDQQAALDAVTAALDAGKFETFLLHGVTGSGKTQVYIDAIHHVMRLGRTAIVLVPEIALTPQTVRRFRAHFGNAVAVFHSRMSPGERYDSWRKTWEGEHKIVIGPRSAIFSPLKNIGLIIVDEEHEPSYKQVEPAPRYHGRDVAVVRGRFENAVVILGSATPSVETFYNALAGKYRLLKLPKRIDDVPMPLVHLVDLRKEPKVIGRSEAPIFSRLLRQKIEEKLGRGEQIILFLNRRGFATMFKCRACGFLAKCSQCDAALTFHLRGRLLKCHYCGYTQKASDRCPQCGGEDVFLRGIGTQRVEEELRLFFPDVKSLRMDLDTTKGRMAHDRVLQRFADGEHQILLGTQMVAKGLDFPNVTLVGVINADTELLLPDFRAAERTFQLLTQVAGRAGRKDKTGEVVIQTLSPDHYSLQFAQKHDYDSFFKAELLDRRALLYPPYSRLIYVLFKGREEKRVEDAALRFRSLLSDDGSFRVLGPAPPMMVKVQNLFRRHLLLMSDKSRDPGGREMKEALRRALDGFGNKDRQHVQIIVDVDPLSFF